LLNIFVFNYFSCSKESPNLLDIGIQIGQTKVFLRREAFDALEALRVNKMDTSAIVLQCKIRGHITRLLYVIQMYCAVYLQSRVRQHLARQIVVSMRCCVAVTKLQTFWRKYTTRCLHMAQLQLNNSATTIQTSWRVCIPKHSYILRKHLVSSIQCHYRCLAARNLLEKLAHQARSLKEELGQEDNLKMKSVQLKNGFNMGEELQLPCKGLENKEESATLDTLGSKDIFPPIHYSVVYRNFPQNPTAKDEEIRRLAEASHQKDKEIEVLRKELEILRKRSTDWSDQKSQKSGTLRSDESESPFALRELFFQRSRWSDASENLVSHATPSNIPNSNRYTGKKIFSSPIEVLQNLSEKVLVKKTSQILKSERNTMDQINLSSEWEDRSSLSDTDFINSTIIAASSTFMDDNYRTTAIHEAVIVQDDIGLLESLDSCNDLDKIINMGDIEGKAALHLAAINSSTKIAKILIDRMAMANVQDTMGNTPLHYAYHVPLMRVLIERGKANPNIPNAMGLRPLHFAVARKHAEAVEYLLASGAQVDVADDVNWYTPLHVLVQPLTASALATDILASQEFCGNNGQESSSFLLAQLLCDANADPNSKDREGNTPFHYAARLVSQKTLELLELFSKKGGDPKVINLKGQTPLHYFCNNVPLRQFSSYHDVLKLLVVQSDTNIATESGCTPLHLALYHQDIVAGEILVKHGAQVNLPWLKVCITTKMLIKVIKFLLQLPSKVILTIYFSLWIGLHFGMIEIRQLFSPWIWLKMSIHYVDYYLLSLRPSNGLRDAWLA
jgi:ankyrin repeat protein